MLSVAFAALVLGICDAKPFGVSLVGESSTAKTFVLKLAASVQGNVDEGSIPTLDSTPAALEQLAVGYRDSFLPLDEIGHLVGNEKQIAAYLKEFSFRQSTGRVKGRAGQYEEAAGLPKETCRNIVGMTTERSIAGINKAAGGRRLTGEAVRLIELPACAAGHLDVFDNPAATSKLDAPGRARGAAIEQLEQLLNEEQGTAAREFLRRLVRDKDAKRKLKNYSDEFIDQCKDRLSAPAQGRVARNVATARAAARLAIEYGVLPWNLRNTDKDLATCLFAALNWMSDESSSGEMQTDEELLSSFLSALAELQFLDLDAREKSSVTSRELERCEAFRRTLNGEANPTFLVKSSWLKNRYPKNVRKRLFAVCINRGIMKDQGRSSETKTHQEKFRGKPIEVYRIKMTFGVTSPGSGR